MRRALRILSEQPRPWRFLASRLLWRTGLCRFFEIRRARYRLRFYPSVLSADLWLDPDGRGADDEFFERYVRPGDTVVDVGANVGSLSVLAGVLAGPQGKVLSIEAHPRTFEFLRGNIELNGLKNVTARNVAAGAETGELQFADRRTDDQNSVLPGDGGIRVKVERLDDLAAGEGRISLLKIDVEGFELPVLLGAGRVLEVTDCVYIEAREAAYRRFGYGTPDVLRALARAGFRVFRLSTDETLRELPAGFVADACENLVASRDPAQLTERTGLRLVEL